MKKTLTLTAAAFLMGTTAMADTVRGQDTTFEVAGLFERWEQSALWSSLSGQDRGDDDDRYERYADRDDDYDDDDEDDRDDYGDRDDDRDDEGDGGYDDD